MAMSQQERDSENEIYQNKALDRFKKALELYRYEMENSGIVFSGALIQTDRESRANLLGAYTKALANPSYTIKWKTSNGFVDLTAIQIMAVGDAVADHVQKCFVAESIVLENIENYSNIEEIHTAFDLAYST